MRSTVRRVVAGDPGRKTHRRAKWVVRKRVRLQVVVLILTLLATTMPASTGKVRGARRVVGMNTASLPVAVYHSVKETLGSLSGWLASYVDVKAPHNTYVPVTAYYTPPPPFISAPADVTVTATTSSSVSLSWSGVGGTNHYAVERSSSVSGPFFFQGNAASTTYVDNTVSNQHSYLYRVRAVSSTGVVSGPSNMALGTAISFEFSSLTNQLIKAQHFYDVRTAINAVRAVAGLSAQSWARVTLGGQEVRANDVNEMRTGLDEGLTALSIPVLAYTDTPLATGSSGTLIKAVHLEQLQTRATRGSSTSAGPLDSDSSTARLDPMNTTGGGGENPLSRNFNFNLPLLSLPGRAGLDLDLTLSYNSLVWSKVGTNSIWFDEDNGFPGPGFRVGFPVIQPLYYNAEVGKNAFLLIGGDGGRTELRQVGTTALYEAGDSSHLLLDTNTMILRTTDGTQMSYGLYGGEYKCTQIKDSNGNYISASYTQSGALTTITDTLGRVITFNYDGNGWLTSITQPWNQSSTPVTHYWARFEYANKQIDTNFPGLTVFGPADGVNVKNLSRVKLADDSYFDFSYTSWGQIWKVSSYAPDAHLVNYSSYNLPQTAGSGLEHDDCPRFTERRDWAQYWNGDTDGTTASNEEALTQFAVPVSDSWTMPDTSSKSGMRAQVTAPDGTSSKIYFIGTAGSATGWQRGLPALVNSYDSAAGLQRQVMTTWTQDDTELSYVLNPRVSETNTYDHPAGNRARTETTYQQFNFANGTSCHLPQDVRQYAANASTILRTTHTEYNTSTTYSNKRILGLVSETRLYEGDTNGTLMSKVGFFYDEDGSIVGTDEPVQHDNASYSAGVVSGRGNVSSVKRYDVNSTALTSTSSKYNTAGAVVSTTNELGYETTISYADSFSDDNNTRNTLAYATTVTDPDEYSSTAKYNFDFGAQTSSQTPLPGVTTNTPGPEQSTTFDTIGRVQKIENLVNNAYTRFDYSNTGLRIDSYTTLQESAGESRSFQIMDGHGRVVGAATDHPGSTGGYSGQRFEYDVMGRTIKTSNPTETSASGAPSSWNTVGDDAAAGWVYTQQTYDWKGRPLVTTNQDLTTRTISYTGCGCAGGEIVSTTDEGVIDATGATRKQQQKTYSDVLGRIVKSEILTWQNGDPYSTTVNSYNSRDQLTLMRTYAGTESSTYQETSVAYDGYGRVKSKQLPEQDANTGTRWSYNDDDTIHVITDPRGATSTFVYDNKRQLVTTATYAMSGKPTITLTYTYDSVGNMLSINDPSGSTDYTYNELSQVSSETREFTGLTGQSFAMSYAYNLAGALKTFTLPTQFGTTVNYQFDRRSRLTGVTDTGYHYSDPTIIEQAVELPMTTFLSNIAYRAWNQMKSMDNGEGAHLEYDYDSRLSPSSYSISNLTTGTMTWDFTYHPNGRIKLASDIANNIFDRKYEYDHVGRLSEAYTGNEARGGSASSPPNSPYRQTNSYDVFGNRQQQTGRIWQVPLSGQSYTYTNNRRQGLQYDEAGHVIGDTQGSHVFDSQGQRSLVTTGRVGGGSTGNPQAPAQETATTYDGRGNPAIITSTSRSETLIGEGPQTTIITLSENAYYLRSTVLGAVIAELNGQGVRTEEYIYAGGERIAQWHVNQWNDSIEWQHENPLTGNWISVSAGFHYAVRTEVDPTGRDIGIQPFFIPPDPPPPAPNRETFFVIEAGPSINAELGMQMYEDRYIKRIFDGGAGPGQEPDGDFWARWQADREWQLQTGARFLFGIDLMNANVPGATYEKVEQWGWTDDGAGITYDPKTGEPIVPALRLVDLSYYRLIPGQTQSPQNPNGPVPQNPPTSQPQPTPSPVNPCDSGLLVPLPTNVQATFFGRASGRDMFSPAFVDKFAQALQQLNAMGIQPIVVSAFRTAADQIRVRSQKSTLPRANVGLSRHQSGNAVDIRISAQFSSIRKVMESVGFIWGGHWSGRNYDPVHFELNPFGPLSSRFPQNQPNRQRAMAASKAAEDYYNNCFVHIP